jgi:flagellar FliL protein
MNEAAPPPPAAGEAAAPAAAAPRRRFLGLALMGSAAVLGLGVGGWFAVPRLLRRAPAPAEAKPAPVAVKATVPLGPVVVNLAGEARRYVRVGLSLGVPAAKDAKAVEDATAQILDIVIAVLSSRSAERLGSGEGREEIKRELIARVHTELGLTKVARVYFTEFVIQ